MGEKVLYRDMKRRGIRIEKNELKSQKTLTPIDELAAFENDLTIH